MDREWTLIPLAGGNYEVANLYSGKVLFDRGSSTRNGTPLEQTAYNGKTNEQWKLLAVEYAPS